MARIIGEIFMKFGRAPTTLTIFINKPQPFLFRLAGIRIKAMFSRNSSGFSITLGEDM
jgi:hypothetical protein